MVPVCGTSICLAVKLGADGWMLFPLDGAYSCLAVSRERKGFDLISNKDVGQFLEFPEVDVAAAAAAPE